MTATRRDLMKIATGLGLGVAMPTTAERAAAITSLGAGTSSDRATDPATFAEQAHYTLTNDDEIEGWSWAVVPTETATYLTALVVRR